MIQIILNHKWQILLIAELTGWLVTIVLIAARYYFQSKKFSYISVAGIVLFDYVPSIFLPIIDAVYTKDIRTWFYEGSFLFNLAVIGLFVFGFTLGKKYLILIDTKVLGFVNHLKAPKEGKTSIDKEV